MQVVFFTATEELIDHRKLGYLRQVREEQVVCNGRNYKAEKKLLLS